MRWSREIYFLLFLPCLLSLNLKGEVIDTVCMGDQFVCYVVPGAFIQSSFEWELSGGGKVVSTHADSVWINWGNVPGLHTLSVREISPSGCIGDLKTARVQVVGTAPSWKNVRICEGETIELHPGDFQDYKWKSGSLEPTITASVPGYYPITLKDKYGCVFHDSIEVIVEELPEVDLKKKYEMFNNRELVIDGSVENAEEYEWFNGNCDPLVVLNVEDIPADHKVWLKVTSQFGCVAGDTAAVNVIDLEKQISFPNVFSPNNDGTNDLFRPLGKMEGIQSYQLIIFNRFGDKVFYSENVWDSWDGTAAGINQPIGTYVYLLKVTFLDGESNTSRGDITLLR